MGKKSESEPANQRPRKRGNEYQTSQPVTGFVEPSERMQDEMAWAGMRYGDPSRPRYATGRVDGKAPGFPSVSPDLTVGCDRETFEQGADPRNRMSSNRRKMTTRD